MIVRTTVKSIQDIMRQDVGVDGDAQRINQLCWMFFLKIIDDQDQELELTKDGYRSPIPEKLLWRNWAADPEDSHADERRENEEAIKRHQAEYNLPNDCIHAMYVDKLDGLVDMAFYDRMSNRWCEEQTRCQREIERRRNADKSYQDEGVAFLDLARNAQRLFAKQEPREKRQLLNFVLSNCTWEDGEVVSTFRQPFDMLEETVTAAAHIGAGDGAESAKTEIWLGDLDSNQD